MPSQAPSQSLCRAGTDKMQPRSSPLLLILVGPYHLGICRRQKALWRLIFYCIRYSTVALLQFCFGNGGDETGVD